MSSSQADEANSVIEKVCVSRGADLIRVGRDVTFRSLGFGLDRQSLQVQGRLGNYELSIPLLGQYQLDNASTAVAALEVLVEKGFNISTESIVNGLANVSWEGRLQVINRHPLVVVDGAHNIDSAQKLMQALKHYFSFERAILIIGLSLDKDVAGIVSELVPFFDKVIVTRSIHPRAMATSPIAAEFKRSGVEARETDDISLALPLALEMAGDNDIICVTGSLFVAAGAIEQAKALSLSA